MVGRAGGGHPGRAEVAGVFLGGDRPLRRLLSFFRGQCISFRVSLLLSLRPPGRHPPTPSLIS